MSVRTFLHDLAGLTGEPLTGGLVAAGQLADDVTGLARAVTVLQAELARRSHAATSQDVLATSAKTVLTAAGVPEPAAAAIRRTGAFTDRWPDLARLVAIGAVNTDITATIAAMTQRLTDQETGQILTAILPTLPQLTKAQAERAVALAIDLLRPHDAASKEQDDWDTRGLGQSHCNGLWQFTITLPGVPELVEGEGAAFWATIDAIADTLRGSDQLTGTRATAAQRRADAVATLVAKAAAGVTPTSKGTPAAAVVTIGLTEAERVTTGPPDNASRACSTPRGSTDIATAPRCAGSTTARSTSAAAASNATPTPPAPTGSSPTSPPPLAPP